MTAAVVDVELRFKKRFELLEELRHGPVRQSPGELRHVPSVRERVAYEQIAVFLLFFPRRKIVGVAHSFANLLHDIEQIRLPRQPCRVVVPRIRAIDVLRAVLNVARSIIHPRQGDKREIVEAVIPGSHRSDCRSVNRSRRTEVKFVDVDVIEGRVEVHFRATFEELRFHFGLGDFRHDDRATKHECTVNDLTVENHLVCRHVGTVDVAEDGEVLRATTERKGDCERVAVRAAEKAVVGDVFKRSVLL